MTHTLPKTFTFKLSPALAALDELGPDYPYVAELDPETGCYVVYFVEDGREVANEYDASFITESFTKGTWIRL